MCGRYVLTVPGDLLATAFGLEEVPELTPRYNVAPSQVVPIVRGAEDGRRELAHARWGLVPHWAKEAAIGNRLINARADGLADKPSFRDSFKRRRCLIPADGFYEWQKVGAKKQPWLLRLAGGKPFAFAGLWSIWTDPESRESLETCAIVTTEPNELAAAVHDRMPVILPEPARETWLDARSDREGLLALLVPFPAAAMEAFPVSTRVNNPVNDDPGCVERIG
jgi:putative SOS response-associated peptidase YedK